ncbi:hypothetical protein EVAR_11103_1 [Eumeta japonica]|uniref:Uncharacterized protein n=1 Tax=Eumeta variegata TaxID=151549 RepID=A0A4C1U422_EUMVA|nr:hypothetical protein EVAR_11103_1 [Eumeta japonica]
MGRRGAALTSARWRRCRRAPAARRSARRRRRPCSTARPRTSARCSAARPSPRRRRRRRCAPSPDTAGHKRGRVKMITDRGAGAGVLQRQHPSQVISESVAWLAWVSFGADLK